MVGASAKETKQTNIVIRKGRWLNILFFRMCIKNKIDLPYLSLQIMVPVLSDGALIAPAVFFALIRNSYFPPLDKVSNSKGTIWDINMVGFLSRI